MSNDDGFFVPILPVTDGPGCLLKITYIRAPGIHVILFSHVLASVVSVFLSARVSEVPVTKSSAPVDHVTLKHRCVLLSIKLSFYSLYHLHCIIHCMYVMLILYLTQ